VRATTTDAVATVDDVDGFLNITGPVIPVHLGLGLKVPTARDSVRDE
jgi:hypothetical protein